MDHKNKSNEEKKVNLEKMKFKIKCWELRGQKKSDKVEK